MENRGAIFLHSMWRTGSSFMLSRFDAEPQYAAFYEPFNGEICDAVLRRRSKADHKRKHLELGHPEFGGGYFAAYDAKDPESGRDLYRFSGPRLPLYDVYNGLSATGENLLAACLRVAEQREQTAVFGFCHSGLQIEQLKARFGGRHVYLYRDPREQFVSYKPKSNDFFIPATILQLLAARDWRFAAMQLAPPLRAFGLLWPRRMASVAPHRLAMNFGRLLAEHLDMRQCYALFYLSWSLSNGHPRQACETDVSITSLAADASARAHFEKDFAISLDGLLAPQLAAHKIDLDFGKIERDVERMIAAWV